VDNDDFTNKSATLVMIIKKIHNGLIVIWKAQNVKFYDSNGQIRCNKDFLLIY